MRFLCLHGVGSSSEVLEWQTAPLRSTLGEDHDFEFICGSHPFPQTAEIQDIFPTDVQYWAYTDPYKPETVINFLEDLKAYIESEGPFDGIIGFSQGAQLASTFLIHQWQKDPLDMFNPFKCAIFFCGLSPFQVKGGTVAKIRSGTCGGSISIPTAHIVGSKDHFYQESRELVALCNETNREVLDHGGVHEIPRGGKITTEMAAIITRTIEKANMLA